MVVFGMERKSFYLDPTIKKKNSQRGLNRTAYGYRTPVERLHKLYP